MSIQKKLNTFRSRFLLIYGTAAFISVLLIVSAGILVNRVTTKYQTLSTVIEPLKFNLLSFNSESNQLAAHQQAYLLSNSEESKEYVAYVSKRLQDRIKILTGYADTLKDETVSAGTETLTVEMGKMFAASTLLEHAETAEREIIIKDQLMPAVLKISKLTKEMNTYLFEQHLSGFTVMMERLENVQLSALLIYTVLMLCFYYIIHKTYTFIVGQVKKLDQEIGELAKGNLPEELSDPENELSFISNSINQLLKNLQGVKEFSISVGKGDFESNISVFDNAGDLGTALASMRQSLKEVSAEDKKRDWVNQGLATFLSIIRDHGHNTEELAYQVLANLVKYIKANQGGIFIADQERHETKLRLVASYAYNRKKYVEKVLLPGQGLVGQAYLERDHIYLKEIPQNYVQITSGLGDSTPRTIYIQPLIVNDEVMGVLELASFGDIAPYVQDFIKKVSESVAAAIGTAQNTSRNKQILEQSQELAEQLRAQEEELRQNTEELQATQEEMHRRILELEKENQLLQSNKHA
ncbi:GAF domain-containing protein [Cesiribacter sp. SM1]|uniref:GAF domain-containing protein n=1 Tax=Cesiribacter sp. SM1 TaxID=2861196 RepID=UPI001CD33E97|nr:GAF domain-containing protein [Cesiribacter sp. SM1]